MTRPPVLSSERIIINAPMSFAGSAQRAWRLRENHEGVGLWMVTAAIILIVLPVWWAAIVCWYLVFGLFLVPYRLLRRGARKRKAEQIRHREQLAMIEKNR